MGYRTYTCPAARTCGGCEWLAVPYPIQLERKQAFVVDALGAIAAHDAAAIDPIAGMDDPRAYRHKCATPFAPGKGGRIRAGFYAAGTHRIVPATTCLAEHPLGRAILNATAAHASRLRIPAYHEDTGAGVLRHGVVRCARARDEALLTLVTNGRRAPCMHALATALMHQFPQLVGVVQNVNTTRGNAMLGRENHTLRGSATVRDMLLGCTFEMGATTFYQTNPAQTELLYQRVVDAIVSDEVPAGAAGGPLRVLDAYCGCGTIGICVARAALDAGIGLRVTGVERVGPSIAAAGRNAATNGVADCCAFVRADATAYLRDLAAGEAPHGPQAQGASPAGRVAPPPEAAGFDVVILDPPRAGSTPEFLAAVRALAPSRVVYVSCNVITQARDLRILCEGGYRVAQVAPVDLFPHTRHVETVVTLVRR